MDLIIWFFLVMIGVSDAQKHRIPNKLVGWLLLAIVIELWLHPDIEWWLHLKTLLVTFLVCFVLYLFGVMAGGDVKLLAVVGFWLGPEAMAQTTPYFIISGGVIGAFYLALYMASSNYTIVEQVKAYAVQKVTPGWKSKQPLVIPFAPAIVIGLAYYFYIH